MQQYQSQAQLFKALFSPTRLAILNVLRDGEQCVCHMESLFGLRQANISQHLMVLRDAGLVSDRRDGKNIFYRVSKPEIFRVIDAVDTFHDAVSGIQESNVKSGTRSSTKRQTCPCPKCNAGAEAIRNETPDLALNGIEAAA